MNESTSMTYFTHINVTFTSYPCRSETCRYYNEEIGESASMWRKKEGAFISLLRAFQLDSLQKGFFLCIHQFCWCHCLKQNIFHFQLIFYYLFYDIFLFILFYELNLLFLIRNSAFPRRRRRMCICSLCVCTL